jgi:probable HAF family extracellular repeat protein
MQDLGILAALPCGEPGEPVVCGGGIATAINIHGTVVGQSTAVSSYLRAFIWENGEMRDLGPFPGQNTNALAINDRGQVLGTVERGPTFLWENGETQIVPFDGSLLGPNGEVVGTRDGHIFIWEAGQVTDLGEGSPIAMNSRGEIIGTRGALPTLWRKKP